MKFNRYTEEQLVEAIDSSFSIRETLGKLGIVPAGGNYLTFKKAVEYLNLDTSHFLGRAANQGNHHKGGTAAQPIENFLTNEVPIQSYKLKNKLLKANLLVYECTICGIKEWNNQKLMLELDHFDGNNQNNNLSNLRLLCPNCHSQTDTFRSKKRNQ